MKRILLINGNRTTEPYPVYPLGMSLVASALRQRGYDCRETDLYYLQETSGGEPFTPLGALITGWEPDLVGLALRNVDNVSWPVPDACTPGYIEAVGHIRRFTKAPLVLGGSALTLFPRRLLEETGADYGIAGEGESAFADLADTLFSGGRPADRIIRADGYLDPGSAGSRDRDPDLARFYLSAGGMLNLQAKRGCPHRCAYCSYPALEGRCYRYRPAANVVDEIESLRDRYGADFYMITDSVFNDAGGHWLETAEELARRGITIPWTCYLRPGRFRDADVALLKRAGLHSVEWGTDCCTDTTLAAMGKDFGWNEVAASHEQFRQQGIYGSHFIMFGGPGETPSTVSKGIANLSSLNQAVVFAGIGIRMFPDTPIVARAVAEGLLEPGADLFEPRFYISPAVDPLWLDSTLKTAFAVRSDRVYGDSTLSEKTRMMHGLGYRGPVWDFLLEERMDRRRRRTR
jgi:radical SAM superfamily enzyme YgiQ (UPF0313 family)